MTGNLSQLFCKTSKLNLAQQVANTGVVWICFCAYVRQLRRRWTAIVKQN
jgi:hypothetical protein